MPRLLKLSDAVRSTPGMFSNGHLHRSLGPPSGDWECVDAVQYSILGHDNSNVFCFGMVGGRVCHASPGALFILNGVWRCQAWHPKLHDGCPSRLLRCFPFYLSLVSTGTVLEENVVDFEMSRERHEQDCSGQVLSVFLWCSTR